MTSKIITSALTAIGAYAVIKYAYEKGEEKGRDDLWDYLNTSAPEEFKEVVRAIKLDNNQKQK